MDHLLHLSHRYETSFGDPQRASNIFSYAACQQLDRRSEFPGTIVARLNEWGMPQYYIPAAFGGSLHGYDELFHLIRLMARRDLTVAIGHGKTMLGAISVWLAGNDTQCQALALRVANHEAISLALTERDHGSDVSASETLWTGCANGYLLNGEKYLINNATRSTALTVFARTDTNKNARDFSMLLVEKSKLSASSFSHLPKTLTHGIKGADISGIRFNNAEVSSDALIGATGHGLEIVLRGFQVSRTLCAALSCGAGDHGLRLAYDFASQRQLYGKLLVQRPVIHNILGRACADLLICDIVGLFGSRAINVIPQEMGVVSAVVKAFVPSSIEAMVDSLVDVLGARAYLEDETEFGSFGKLQRDCRLVSLFDGNTLVNLQSLIMQLPALARYRRQAEWNESNSQREAELFNLSSICPTFDRRLLSLSSKGRDSITLGLLRAQESLNICTDLAPDLRDRLQTSICTFQEQLAQIDTFFMTVAIPARQIDKPFFDMAERYGKVFAASCCVQAFVNNRPQLAAPLQDGEWLAECLQHLSDPDQADYSRLLAYLDYAVTTEQLISVFPLPLAQRNAKEVSA